MARALADLFDRCKIEESVRAYFNQGEVRSLAVSPDKKTMICHVGFKEIVPVKALGLLERAIAKAYALTRMRISPRYELEGLTEGYLRTLRDRLCAETPSACGLLADSEWKTEQGELHISMSRGRARVFKACASQHGRPHPHRNRAGGAGCGGAVRRPHGKGGHRSAAQRAQTGAGAGGKGMPGARPAG